MAADYVYPFGQEVTARPPSTRSPRPVFVLGAYPSALHVSWRPIGGRLVRAIPVADEPEPFWNGGDAEERLDAWKAGLRDPDALGEFAVPPALNGPSGGWVDMKVLAPLGVTRDDVCISDCLDTYRMSTGVERVIESIYRPLGFECHLLPHPSESQIVTEALGEHCSRLLGEFAQCKPETVVTLGNAAARVFAELVGRPQRKLSTVGYGEAERIQLDRRDVRWLPLAHPAAPRPYQLAHDVWVAARPS